MRDPVLDELERLGGGEVVSSDRRRETLELLYAITRDRIRYASITDLQHCAGTIAECIEDSTTLITSIEEYLEMVEIGKVDLGLVESQVAQVRVMLTRIRDWWAIRETRLLEDEEDCVSTELIRLLEFHPRCLLVTDTERIASVYQDSVCSAFFTIDDEEFLLTAVKSVLSGMHHFREETSSVWSSCLELLSSDVDLYVEVEALGLAVPALGQSPTFTTWHAVYRKLSASISAIDGSVFQWVQGRSGESDSDIGSAQLQLVYEKQ